MTPAARHAAALRKRRQRLRAKNGRRILRVEIDYHPIIEALLVSTRLTETEALDQHKIEAAAAELLAEWAGHWLK
jgi:hypothetical protein